MANLNASSGLSLGSVHNFCWAVLLIIFCMHVSVIMLSVWSPKSHLAASHVSVCPNWRNVFWVLFSREEFVFFKGSISWLLKSLFAIFLDVGRLWLHACWEICPSDFSMLLITTIKIVRSPSFSLLLVHWGCLIMQLFLGFALSRSWVFHLLIWNTWHWRRSLHSSHSVLGAVSAESQNVGNPDTADAPLEVGTSTLDNSRSATLEMVNRNLKNWVITLNC